MAVAKGKNPRIKYRRSIFALFFATFLVAGSSFGWVKFQEEQERKIILAQSLIIKECKEQTEADNFSETSKNVNQAVKLLDSVPKLPGTTYPKARKELTNFSRCIKTVNAKDSLLNAQNLSKQAFSVDNQTILPLDEWQKIRFNLETAIVEIQSIPADIDVSKQAQTEIDKYQNQLKIINQKTQNEQIAVNTLNRANSLKSQAENPVRFNKLKSLSKAELKIKNAIQLINNIPEKTTISENKKDYLKNYQTVLNNIQYKIAVIRLNNLVDSFQKFAKKLHHYMGYIEYSQRLESLKFNFDNVFNESFAIENDTTKYLEKALSYYDDALVIKRYCYEGNCIHSTSVLILRSRWRTLWLPTTFKLNGVPITEKYVLPATRNILRIKYIRVNDALQRIYFKAEEQINQIK